MLNIIANLLEHKVAQHIEHADKLVRDGLHDLYNVVHKQFPDFEEVATNKGIEGNQPHQVKAQLGHEFAKKVINIIDELYSNHDSLSLGEILDTLINLIKLINDNKNLGFDSSGFISKEIEPSATEFPHLVQFCALIPGGDKSQRKTMFQKVRKAIYVARSLAISLIDQIRDIKQIDPDAVKNNTSLISIDDYIENFDAPPIAMAPIELLKKFVRIWGPQKFNIVPTLEQMSNLDRRKNMNGLLTNFLNSLNRGGNGGANKDLVLNELKKVMDPYLDDMRKEK